MAADRRSRSRGRIAVRESIRADQDRREARLYGSSAWLIIGIRRGLGRSHPIANEYRLRLSNTTDTLRKTVAGSSADVQTAISYTAGGRVELRIVGEELSVLVNDQVSTPRPTVR